MTREQTNLDHIREFLGLLASVSDGDIIYWDAASGKFISIDVGAFLDDYSVVRSAGSSVAGNIPTFFDTTGEKIQDSLISLSTLVQDFCEGRLTLTSGTPVTTADVTAATTIYFAPYKGNRIALYDAASTLKWYQFPFTQRSIAVPATTNTNYDVFIYISAGTISLELVAWTNATTRATALTTQDGILVKSGDASRRYLGSFRTTGVSGQTEDSRTKRFVWNYYNRVKRPLHYTSPTSTWTYATATWRQANAAAGAQVELVCGWLEDELSLKLVTSIQNATNTVYGAASIGEDSTTVPHADSHYQGGGGTAASLGWFQAVSTLDAYPSSVGYHYYAWLEYATGATVTFLGGTGGNYWRGGFNGSWFC